MQIPAGNGDGRITGGEGVRGKGKVNDLLEILSAWARSRAREIDADASEIISVTRFRMEDEG